ncbi:MAG: radical SAM protein [Planctomycetaceae bacterium]|nr:radical SAM protein [Planctomycetaceae bacterium]
MTRTLTNGLHATADEEWQYCRFLTCSVLPVRSACNLQCPFCFSKSSISSMQHDTRDWAEVPVEDYYQFAKDRGATRLVITGGGEPLLKAKETVSLIRRGREYFEEIACFTNGTYLTRPLAEELAEAGLSYLCYSRHDECDVACRELMGAGVPTLEDFFRAATPLKVRATCVMTKGHVDSEERVDRYMESLAEFGVTEFTFKHTYIAYESSVFGQSEENQWAESHQIEFDPFDGRGEIVARLPWGPAIRRLGKYQVCYYYEPTPAWEKEHQLCRSSNLLLDGKVYASLEDQRSRLFRLGG